MANKKKATNKKARKPVHLDLGIFLLGTGALANITIWIGAFVATESKGFIGEWVRTNLLPVLGGISGLSMGLTVTIGLVFVLAKLAGMKPSIEHKVRGKDEYKSVPNVRYYGAWAAIGILMIISPVLLAPYIFMTISGAVSLFAVLGDTWARVWSVGRIVAADLALGAIALVQGVHLPSVATSTAQPGTATSASDSNKSASRTPKAKSKSATKMQKCEVKGCGMEYAWPNGKGAHYKKYHPDLVIRKAIPVGKVTSQTVEKQ